MNNEVYISLFFIMLISFILYLILHTPKIIKDNSNNKKFFKEGNLQREKFKNIVNVVNKLNVPIKINDQVIEASNMVNINSSVIQVFVKINEEWKLYNFYHLSPQTKQLYIGAITTRLNEPESENDRLVNTGYQTNGRPWVKIHNLTSLPLKLNDNIVVAPKSVYRYLGRYNFGVALGTYFVDADKIYPTFQYLVPNSDIYYGYSSIQNPYVGDNLTQYEQFDRYPNSVNPSWVFSLGLM